MKKSFEQLVADLTTTYGSAIIRPSEAKRFAKDNGYVWNYQRFLKYKVGHGQFQMCQDDNSTQHVAPPEQPKPKEPKPTANTVVTHSTGEVSYIPSVDPNYVSHGFHSKLVKIIKSKQFYPVFITGLSGNGKTFMAEQVAAIAKREIIRTNITAESDENSLIGGFRLVDGNTKWQDGPVVTAMKRGSILLLDEIDLGTSKILCLQSILEGKPYFNKQTGELVTPTNGFNIIATANTKGKGSDDGRFVGTNVLNEAFLERFPITVEQPYPTKTTEKKIVTKMLESVNIDDNDYVVNLVDWADTIRKTFYAGGIDEVISTRRLGHIAKATSIFGSKLDAIKYCINRFDDETKEAMLDLYTKIDSGVSLEEIEVETEENVSF